jgi:hypothetical protein
VSIQLFRGTLIEGNRVVFRFKLVVTGTPSAVIQYYLEFGDDPAPDGVWYREVAEEDQGGGNVLQPIVVRTLEGPASAALPAGTYLLSAQFRREEQMARLQIKASAGAVVAVVTAPFGQIIL